MKMLSLDEKLYTFYFINCPRKFKGELFYYIFVIQLVSIFYKFKVKMNKQKYTLLYIEDNKKTQLFTSLFLKPYFVEIYNASDGAEALAIYNKYTPDIIITDIKMPKMSGLEFCRKIRDKDIDTPVIITTSYMSVEYLLEAVSLNLVKYLGKPIKESELMEALESCFERIESQNPSVVQITKEMYYDTLNQLLSSRNEIIHLSLSETMILDILIKNQHRVVSYVEIQNYITFSEGTSIESLRTLVGKLRKIVGKKSIKNISKTGYKINLYG